MILEESRDVWIMNVNMLIYALILCICMTTVDACTCFSTFNMKKSDISVAHKQLKKNAQINNAYLL